MRFHLSSLNQIVKVFAKKASTFLTKSFMGFEKQFHKNVLYIKIGVF